MDKIKLDEIVVVEGKYDALKLANIVDAVIIPVGGFSVFTSRETRELIVALGQKKGIIVLTDSDEAGFRIRRYINTFAQKIEVKNAYLPQIEGKEKRKAKMSKEGIVGVEGTPNELIIKALMQVAQNSAKNKAKSNVTYADLYEAGLSGTSDSADKRREFLRLLGLPPRLSKKALCDVINLICTREEFWQTAEEAQNSVREKNSTSAGQKEK